MIREATRDDLPYFYDISLSAHQEGYKPFIPASEWPRFSKHYTDTPTHRQKFLAKLFQHFEDPTWTIWVAEIEGKIVGYTLAEKVSEDAYYKRGLFVAPSSQGKGIGKALFQRSLKGIEEKEVYLTVIATNVRATTLYKENGFKETTIEAPTFYGARQIVMSKPGEDGAKGVL